MRQIDHLIQVQVKSVLLSEAIHQSFKSNQKPGDPWPKTNIGKWPANMIDTQNFLEKIKASKFNIGSNSVGLADYPVYVLNWRTETYWFYHDTELFALGAAKFGREMGYDVKGDKLNIYADSETKDKTTFQGYYKWTGTDLTWYPVVKSNSDPKSEFAENAHMVLDWIGFIPGIGEVADAVNAIWYFVEGKTLEGCLSLISLIPIIGSALGAAGKVALKGISKVGKISDTMGDVTAAIVKTINPSAGMMREIKDGLQVVADKIGSSKQLSNYIPQKTIDDILDALHGAAGKLDDLTGVAKASADASAGLVRTAEKSKLAANAVSKVGILGDKQINKLIRKFSSLTYERSAKESAGIISKLPIVGSNSFLRKVTKISVHPKKAAAVIESLQRTFIKNLRKDPDKMLVILRTSKEIPKSVLSAFAKKGDDVLNAAVRNLDVKSIRKLGGTIKYIDSGAEVVRDISKLTDSELGNILYTGIGKVSGTPVTLKNLNEIDTKTLKKLMPDGDDLTSAATDLGKHAIEKDNPIWSSMLSNPVEKLKTLFPYGNFGNFVNHFEAAALDARKWLDIVYNEVAAAVADSTLADKIPGLADSDPARENLVYDAVEGAMKEHTPKFHSAIKTTIGRDSIASKLSPDTGLPTSNLDAYDPNKSV